MCKVIIKKSAYCKLLTHVHKTNFQYETGGLLLGYKCLRTFYVVAFTFPRHLENKAKMTFLLNGREHEEVMKRIRKNFIIQPEFVGVWHSHTINDKSLSLQDEKSNQVLVRRFGRIISAVITPGRDKHRIRVIPYCISENSRVILCKIGLENDSIRKWFHTSIYGNSFSGDCSSTKT